MLVTPAGTYVWVGIAEMKVAVEKTGGRVVLSESFGHSVFKESFKRVFEDGEQSLGLCFNSMLEINCSKNVKIEGILGPCISLEKKGPSVSEKFIGEGGTTAWKLCELGKSTCLTVLFDLSSSETSSAAGAINEQLYLQFVTSYQNPEGQSMLRVTTVTRRWSDSAVSSEDLIQGFDQETAAVVMARLVSFKMESAEEFDATRWLDRSLIRICSKFGDYRKDDPISFTINPCNTSFAQLLQAPMEDAQLIIMERFPVPRLVVCDQHGSQARFLLAKLNPSATYNNTHEMSAGSDIIFTDDVSLQFFTEHLQKLTIQRGDGVKGIKSEMEGTTYAVTFVLREDYGGSGSAYIEKIVGEGIPAGKEEVFSHLDES